MSTVGRRLFSRALAPPSLFRSANVMSCSSWNCALSSIRPLFTGPAPKTKFEAKQMEFPKESFDRLGPFWLRENCQCRHCVNPKTKQRQVDTFAIPKDVQSESVTYATYGLKVEWSDGHLGLYPYPWLRAYGSKRPVTVPIAAVHTVKPRPYEAYALKAEFRPYPTVSFEDVMSSDNGVLRWLDRIHIFGFCFVKDMPANPASTEELLKRISFIRPTHYGAFWDFTADMTFKDSAYTNEALGAHTDNTYFTDPARLQLFHLLSHQGGAGGATLLVDGFKAAEAMRKENKPNYMAFMRTTQPYHSSGNEDVCIQPIHEFPVFEVHPQLDQLYRIRWNNYDRAPKANWDSKELTKWYTAARHWNEILTRSKHQIWIQLEPGMALTIDNWRMLHGRSAFTGKRRMCGGYINNDDFLSRYRLLKYGRQALLNNIGNYNDRSARDNPNVVI